MLLARVRLTPPFRQARKSLELPVGLQTQVRHMIRMDPLAAEMIYQTRSVESRHPNAGLYQRPVEVRDKWGFPNLVLSRYLYVDHNMPVFVYDLCSEWPSPTCMAVAPEDAELAEDIAQLMAATYGDSV